MNKGSSFAKNSKEDTQKSEKKCKAFKDISKYFSKEEWAKLGYSDKITYVYMKRNYDTMTSLGLRATLPAFMCPKKRAMQSNGRDSDDDQNENQGPRKLMSSVWAYRLRERKTLIVYEEISDPEEDD
ncbi:protein SSX4 [Mustela nigripes]|uniref:protein SSX4 n=1 Tax=Mustela nigripes TaxID=77151 RepID=UPI00281548A2|nr:protein SSX4 [Mustela nigripes]